MKRSKPDDAGLLADIYITLPTPGWPDQEGLQWVLTEHGRRVCVVDARPTRLNVRPPQATPRSKTTRHKALDSPPYNPSSPQFPPSTPDSPPYSASEPTNLNPSHVSKITARGSHYNMMMIDSDNEQNIPCMFVTDDPAILDTARDANPHLLFPEIWHHSILPLLENAEFARLTLGLTCRYMAAHIPVPKLPVGFLDRAMRGIIEGNGEVVRQAMAAEGFHFERGTTRRGFYLFVLSQIDYTKDIPFEDDKWSQLRIGLIQENWNNINAPLCARTVPFIILD